MAYGASIHAPMTSGYEPPSPYNVGGSAPAPDISIEPMQDASPAALGRRNTLVTRLPAMPAGEMGDLSYTDYAQMEAALYAQALRIAGDERRAYERQNKNISKAKNRAAQRIAEKRTRLR